MFVNTLRNNFTKFFQVEEFRKLLTEDKVPYLLTISTLGDIIIHMLRYLINFRKEVVFCGQRRYRLYAATYKRYVQTRTEEAVRERNAATASAA